MLKSLSMASSAKRSRFITDDDDARVQELIYEPDSENEGMSSNEESIVVHQLACESKEMR